jgi:hypothetical protein
MASSQLPELPKLPKIAESERLSQDEFEDSRFSILNFLAISAILAVPLLARSPDGPICPVLQFFCSLYSL